MEEYTSHTASSSSDSEGSPSLVKRILSLFIFRLRLPVILLLILPALAAGGTAYGIYTKPEVLGLRAPDRAEVEAEKVLADVGKLISLPEGENPTIATVTDVEKVKEQQFFFNAQNGDKVLIYSNTRKIILYRPEENKIIEVGALNINQQQQEETSEGEVAEPTATPKPSPTPEPEADDGKEEDES